MKKLVGAAVILLLLVVGALFGYVLLNGPRMREQPHVRAFQVPAPLPPLGTVTVPEPGRLEATGHMAAERNPLTPLAQNLQRGEVYYRYYCTFCHGDGGAGNGPVGESYMPVPGDLRSLRVRNYRDQELLRAMLTGIGHEPVLERIVPPRHRWYLVLYVRSLAGG